MKAQRRGVATQAAHHAGYAKGWSDGYRLGASQTIAEQLPVPTLPTRPLKVLFVRENSTGYHLIENGIVDSLSKVVQELVVVNTLDPLLDIAKREQPDLMLVLNGIFVLQPEVLDSIRAMGIRTAAWYADDPYFMALSSRLVNHYDHVFTHEAGVVEYYRSLGSNAHYLPFAANVERIRPVRADSAYWSDICFIGSAFPNRIEFFNRLMPVLRGKRIIIAGGGWQGLKEYRAFKASIRLAGVQVDEALHYYNGARIVINLHRQPASHENVTSIDARSVNPRTFEINACATLQLTDIREDLSTLYAPGAMIETYDTATDCAEKIEHYLHHEEQRLQIALNGYAATRQAHTYTHRIDLLLRTIYGEQ